MVLCEKLLLLLFLLVFINISPCISSSCPWLAPNLARWSDPLTWGNQGIPEDGDTVVLNQAILFDTETARLNSLIIKFIYSEKATKFCEICTLLLTAVHIVKSKVKISQTFLAFSEYMNFKGWWLPHLLP